MIGFTLVWGGQLVSVLADLVADRLMEPAMRSDTRLSRTFAGITGSGSGSGMALQFVAAGALCSAIDAVAPSVRAVRDVETILHDREQAAAPDGAS